MKTIQEIERQATKETVILTILTVIPLFSFVIYCCKDYL